MLSFFAKMVSNMKDYSKMSDVELNKLITGFQFDCYDWPQNINGDFHHCGFDGEAYFVIGVKDYCNNPSDAWPIINIERIGVYPSEGPDFMPWIAAKNAFSVTDKNPLRAAMIVYLMMKDEDK